MAARNYILKALDKGQTVTEALILLLDRIGFYAFNRYCFNQGFQMEYVLHLHRENAKTKKNLKNS